VYSVFEEVPMQRTNVVLDEKLVQEGLKLFKKKTKRELIDFALREVIRREKARGILALEGKVKWEGDLQEMRKGRFADLG
jgi:Arc/MetJ family transcription regulator